MCKHKYCLDFKRINQVCWRVPYVLHLNKVVRIWQFVNAVNDVL